MKIALITTSLFHQGEEYVVAALARGLVAHGHAVTIILSKFHEDWQRAHPDWKPFELSSKVQVVVLPCRRARYSVFSLRQIIKNGGFDVVMCHSSPFACPLVLAVWGLKNRPVLIYVEHSSGVGTTADGKIVAPRFAILEFCENWIKKHIDAQFAVSDGTSDAICRMTGYPRSRIFTVYNPVIDPIYMEKLVQRAKHPWLRHKTLPVVVAAAAFRPFKNHVLLLQAFAHVITRTPARLIIFGEGPLRSEYEQTIHNLGISEFVSLPGFTDNLPAEIRPADCFVVSSKIESFSVVLVEALAAGVPVVSTNCPYGPPEILENGKNGILVENNNAEALAEGVLKVLSGGGIAPTSLMVSRFTMEAVVRRYEDAMREVLARNMQKML